MEDNHSRLRLISKAEVLAKYSSEEEENGNIFGAFVLLRLALQKYAEFSRTLESKSDADVFFEDVKPLAKKLNALRTAATQAKQQMETEEIDSAAGIHVFLDFEAEDNNG